jgi:hypothetical protein
LIEGWGRARAFLFAAGGGPGAVSGPSDLWLHFYGIDGDGLARNVDTLAGAPALRAGHGGFSFCSLVHDDAARR